MKSLLFSALSVSIALLGSGCGPGDVPRTQVKGKVTVAGKGPLTGGTIVYALVSDLTKTGSGTINGDGTYMVPTAPIGECKVAISNKHLLPNATKGAPMMAGSAKPKDMDAKTAGGPKGLPTIGEEAASLPLKYLKISDEFATPDKTTLKSTVSQGSASPADFDVK